MTATSQQIREVLRKQALARATLTGFAQYIDIPGVPLHDGVSDREFEVIDTPLALHHVVMLNAMQLMAQGLLIFDRESMTSPVDWSLLRGEKPQQNQRVTGQIAKPPAPVEIEKGTLHANAATPTDFKISNPFVTIHGGNGNKHGDITCLQKSSTSSQVEVRSRDTDTGSSDPTLASPTLSMPTDLSESQLRRKREPTRSQPAGSSPESSAGAGSRRRTDSGRLEGEQSEATRRGGVAYWTDDAYLVRTAIWQVLRGTMSALDCMGIIDDVYGHLDICRRVMLMMPPGSAKSTYASVVFPSWVMGQEKAFETILTGWGDPICRRHGKRARQICSSPQYQALFAENVDPNTRAAEDWQLTNFSSYKSSGIQAGISGFRTHGLIWDDMIKGRQDADSPTVRGRVWDEYVDSARSRKTPKAWEVGVGTRWHEDEHMGRILPEGYNGESGFMECRDGNVWMVLCFAAECERTDDPLGRKPGEMIWQEWFDEDYWQDKRRNPRSWASLYQQRPAPEEGLLFKKDKFKRYTELPEGEDFICMDPGVSDVGDPTSIMHFRIDALSRLYLVKRYYAQVGMDVWIEQLIRWAKGCGNNLREVVSEAGVIRKASEPFIIRAMRKTNTFFTQVFVNRHSNKKAMAAPAIALVNSGQVYVPHNSDGEDFIASCLRFPGSDDDHDVDAFANLCQRLDVIWDMPKIETQSDEPVIIGGSFGGKRQSIKSFMPKRTSTRKSRWSARR